MRLIFTHNNPVWKVATQWLAVLSLGIFSVANVVAQTPCTTGCTASLNVSVNPNGTLTATADNQTLCLTGSGNFNGTVDFGGRNGIRLCIGPLVNYQAYDPSSRTSRIINVLGNGKIIDNYGAIGLQTLNSSIEGVINLRNITINNFGATEFGTPVLPTITHAHTGTIIENGILLNSSAALNASGIFNVNPGATFNNRARVSIQNGTSIPFIFDGNGTFNQNGGTTVLNGQSFGVTTANVTGGNLILEGALLQVTGNFTQTGGNVSGGGNPLQPGSGCGSVNVAGISSIFGGTFGGGTGQIGMCDPSTRNNTTNVTGFDNQNGGSVVDPNGRLKCDCFIALPVTLVYFRVAYVNSAVNLNWATAAEKDNDYFTIERSTDGITFTEFTRIKGAGNSTGLLTYQHTDANPMDGLSYYRLKQTDLDGKFSYSQVKSVNTGTGTTSRTVSIFPNPVTQNEYVQVAVTDVKDGELYVSVFNQVGQQCFEARYPANTVPSIQVREFSASAGLYILQARKGNTIIREKLVVQ